MTHTILSQSNYSVRRTFIELNVSSGEVPLKRCNTWDGSLSCVSPSDCDDAASETTSFGSANEELLSDETSENSSVQADAEHPPQLSADDHERTPAPFFSNMRASSAEWCPQNWIPSQDHQDLAPAAGSPVCKFSSECYSKRCRFAHPTADGALRSDIPRNCVGLRPCKYGSTCFNLNREHRQRFRHTEDDGDVSADH